MRRALASLLVALFSFGLIAPVLCAETASHLPACCRRSGEHHCGMADGMAEQTSGSAVKSIQPKCPLFPKAAAMAVSFNSAILGASSQSAAPPALFLAAPKTDENIPQIALRGSAHKRGPPSSLD